MPQSIGKALVLTPPLCCGGHHCPIFRKKGFFLGLSFVSTSTLKYLLFPSHRKMGAHHGWRSFAALFVTFPTESSAVMALPGFLWLGWVGLGACHKHVHVHPFLQDAARHKPNARHNIHTRMVSCKPAGDLGPVLGRRELLKEN